MATITIPEPGQLVDVRLRRCVVNDVSRTIAPTTLLTSTSSNYHHLVTLSPVEEDSFGEELRVIWELEPGARIYEKTELPKPTDFDDPRRIDAFLDAVKWGASSIADTRSLLSPFRSGIDIEEYQLDPVVRAIQMHRVNLLIGDGVGLGKTIEAGLVCQELIARHYVRRVLIVCPSSLQIQWQEQMRDKFGLAFRIVDSNLMKELRRQRGIHANPWTHFPRLITSIDFLKRDRPLRLFREALPAEGEPRYPRRFDLLIVDEAHNIAPSGSGNYATDSLRTIAIRRIAPHFEHKLFLSATPHNGYQESFTALLELLDPQRFARGVEPDKHQLDVVMVRRLKEDLPPRWDGTPKFPIRKLQEIAVPYTENEKHIHTMLRTYTELRRKGASSSAEKYATEFVLKLLKKRLFSSPAAFASTLEQHIQSISSARKRKHSTLPTVSLLRNQIEAQEEEFADDNLYEDTTEEVVNSASRLFRELGPEEEAIIKELQSWGKSASVKADSKAAELINWLNTHIRPNGKWSNQRVLIFTEYKATQKWLYSILASEGFTEDDRLMTIHGGIDSKERERIKAAFQSSPDIAPVRILLATDAASEGLNLQNHCSKLIHYEIPWNPNKMEQRNGRIDRYGQKSPETLIYHFVSRGYETKQGIEGMRPGDLDGDLEFLMHAARKVDRIREDLGKVGPVIAQQVEEAMLGKRSRLETEKAESESEPVRRMLKFERNVFEQIKRLQDQFQETRKSLRLTPSNIQSVVTIGLELADQPPLIETKVKNLNGYAFHLPSLQGSWSVCNEGLAHPHTGDIRPIVFDPDLARDRDDVVLVHLNHRLVQMCLRFLRSEVWTTNTNKRLNRVTARLVPSSELEVPAVIAHGRVIIFGKDQQRLHEEVIVAGGLIKEGRFSRLNKTQTEQLLEAALQETAPDQFRKRLSELWPKLESPLLQSLEVRMQERAESLQKSLHDRADKEIANVTALLKELEQSILEELKKHAAGVQLRLFSTEEERKQFERNISSLKARLEKIPHEIQQETTAIQTRFKNPKTRLFPLSVTFLIPQKLATGGKY